MAVKTIQLCSVRLDTESLSDQAQFYNDRWGLEPVVESSGEVYFRAEGDRHHVLSLHQAGRSGLRSITFELAPDSEMNEAFDALSAADVEVVSGPTKDFAPGIEQGMVVRDPDGNLVELVTGIGRNAKPYGERDVKPQDVNHLVLESPDPETLAAFYTELLGFRLTEEITGVMSFYACNTNHHSIAFAQAKDGKPAGLNHVAFALSDWEAWAKALYYAGERGLTRLWGPGRHTVGRNLFSYYLDAERNAVEYTAEVEQVDPQKPPIFHELGGGFAPDMWSSAK